MVPIASLVGVGLSTRCDEILNCLRKRNQFYPLLYRRTNQALKQCERAATRDRQARAAAVAIQSVWRTRTAKSSFARDMDRIIRLQALSRGMASRALARERQHSAVSLQAAWRGMRARSSHLRAVTGILVLQALVRGVQMRVRLRRERREADERAKAALRAAERAEAAAGILQTWLRRCAAMKRRRLEEQKAAADARAAAALAAAVKMQAVVRGTLARRTLGAAVRAATVLQALVRGRQARDNIIRRSAAAVKIQSTARAASACALVRMIVEDRRQKRVAVVTIQALWRGMIVRATLSDRMSAAAVVQRCGMRRSSTFYAALPFMPHASWTLASCRSIGVALGQDIRRGHCSLRIFVRNSLLVTIFSERGA